MLLTLTDVPLRTASFSLEDRCLLWARARLYTDRLTLRGMGLRERYWRHIPLDKIERVKADGQRLILQLDDGKEVSFYIKETRSWRIAIRAHRYVLESPE